MKLKKVLSLALAGVMTLGLVACGGAGANTKGGNEKGTAKENVKEKEETKIEDVKLTVWVSKEQQKMIKTMCDEFSEANKDKVNLTVELGIQSEEEMREAVLTDVKGAADIYSMANDQLGTFVESKALAEVTKEDFPDVFTRNTEISVQTGTVDGKLYVFPRTADNGYFLYYNKNRDVRTCNLLLRKCILLDGNRH